MAIEMQIYTSCPQGEGLEETGGFQIKARSTGITETMSKAIVQYTSRYLSPRDLQRQENEYYGRGEDLPSEFLARFPVGIIYHQITDDLFGLTRTHYMGKDHTNRAGNYWAHTLVFEPEVLEACGYNPVSLTRSRIYDFRPAANETALDPVLDLGPYIDSGCQPPQNWMQKIAASPVIDSYDDVLAAFVSELPQQTPVVLCFPNQADAISYIEQLLMLLPPDTRSRTTFSTYEPDPQAHVQGNSSRLQIMVTIPPTNGGMFEFRQMEMNRFLVWDFTEKRMSAFPKTTAYSQKTLELVGQQQKKQLETLQETLVRLGAGRIPASWDSLVVAGQMLEHLQDDQKIQAALNGLEQVAQQESQIDYALELLWPVVECIAQGTQQSQSANQVYKTFATLYKRVPGEATYHEFYQDRIIHLIGFLLQAGNVMLAHHLASLFNPIWLQQAIDRLQEQNWPDLDQTDDESFQYYASLLEALSQIQETKTWAAEKLWYYITVLIQIDVDAPNTDQMVQTLIKLYPALTAHFPEGQPFDAIKLARRLMSRGHFVRANQMVLLSGQETVSETGRLYDQLLATGWPMSLRQPAYAGQKQALLDLIDLTLKTDCNLARIGAALYLAEIHECLIPLWDRCKKSMMDYIRLTITTTETAKLIANLKTLLLPYPAYTSDLFDLALMQAENNLPGSHEAWIACELDLLQLAGSRNKDALELVRKNQSPAKSVEILGELYARSDLSEQVRQTARTMICEIAQQQVKEAWKNGGPAHNWSEVQQTFNVAHKIQMADTLWDFLSGTSDIKNVLEKGSDEGTIHFIASIIPILANYDCADKLYSLHVWRLSTSQDLNQLQATVNDIAVMMGQSQLDTILNRITSLSRPLAERIVLMNTVYLVSGIDKPIINYYRKYFNKHLAKSSELWEIRKALAAQAPDGLLMIDFMDNVFASPEDVKHWYSNILSDYPLALQAVSNTLTNYLLQTPITPAVLEVTNQLLATFENTSQEPVAPLATTFIAVVPFETLITNWQSGFDQMPLMGEKSLEAEARRTVYQQVCRLTTQGDLSVEQVFAEMEQWLKMQKLIDKPMREWAIQQITPVLLRADINPSLAFNQFLIGLKRSLQTTLPHHRERSIELSERLSHDPVNLTVYLVALAQYSIQYIDSSDGLAIAQVVNLAVEFLPSPQRELFWYTIKNRVDTTRPNYTRFEGMARKKAVSDDMDKGSGGRFGRFFGGRGDKPKK